MWTLLGTMMNVRQLVLFNVRRQIVLEIHTLMIVKMAVHLLEIARSWWIMPVALRYSVVPITT